MTKSLPGIALRTYSLVQAKEQSPNKADKKLWMFGAPVIENEKIAVYV